MKSAKLRRMNAAKCDEYDYINFLIAAQQVFSAVEAAKTHPSGAAGPAHDAYTRLLQRVPPDSKALSQLKKSPKQRKPERPIIRAKMRALCGGILFRGKGRFNLVRDILASMSLSK